MNLKWQAEQGNKMKIETNIQNGTGSIDYETK